MAQSFGQRLASLLGRPADSAADHADARLIVGLGNPGKRYARTRHNIGFEVVDCVADKLGWCKAADFDRLARQKFEGLMHEGTAGSGGAKLVLLKPTTFMNLSGQAVQKAARFYKLGPPQILIVLDEMALPAGKLRLRASGSDGGHNGLRDIEQALGTDQYARLRIGVDPVPPGQAGQDYVLGKFTGEQRERVDAALPRAVECCLSWFEEGVAAAMNRFNA